MTHQIQHRHPEGTPAGGQFAPTHRAAPGLALVDTDSARPDWTAHATLTGAGVTWDGARQVLFAADEDTFEEEGSAGSFRVLDLNVAVEYPVVTNPGSGELAVQVEPGAWIRLEQLREARSLACFLDSAEQIARENLDTAGEGGLAGSIDLNGGAKRPDGSPATMVLNVSAQRAATVGSRHRTHC